MAEQSGLELTRTVAERLGWTGVVQVDEDMQTFLSGERGGFAWVRVPAFAVDVNAALQLVPGEANTLLQRDPDTGDWYASLVGRERSATATAKSLAEALCRCFLAWTDGPESREPDVLAEAEDFLEDDVTVDDMHALVRGLVDEVKRLREAAGKE